MPFRRKNTTPVSASASRRLSGAAAVHHRYDEEINHLDSVMAKWKRPQGFDEALILNDDGFIAKRRLQCIFREDGRLLTPALNSGILPGVTRDLVMELAAGWG